MERVPGHPSKPTAGAQSTRRPLRSLAPGTWPAARSASPASPRGEEDVRFVRRVTGPVEDGVVRIEDVPNMGLYKLWYYKLWYYNVLYIYIHNIY